MKLRLLALLFGAALLLTACTPKPTTVQGDDTWSVYFTSAALGSAALVSEPRTLPAGTDTAEGLLRALLAGPMDETLTSPIPRGVQLLSQNMDEQGVLTVDLSERYGGLSGVALTQADYCIALTLCEIPEVTAVMIHVEGAPIPFRSHQLLRASDVILSGSEDAPVLLTATLYYPRVDGGLGTEARELLITENDTLTTVLLTALMDGPTDPALYFPLPEGTQLLSAYIDTGICYANFSAPFADAAPASRRKAELLLYSIVNTLCAQESITAVHLLVDGKSPKSYGGIPTATPLESNLALAVP